MPLLIGTDEAGYGPNLGPLVIAATVWRIPEAVDPANMFHLLQDSVSRDSPKRPEMIQADDSKRVYGSGRSIDVLEKGVLTFARSTGIGASTVEELLTQLSIGPEPDAPAEHAEPWFDEVPRSLPVASDPAEIELARTSLCRCCHSSGLEPLGIASQVVMTRRFNQRVELMQSKGLALSFWTLELVRHAIETYRSSDEERVIVVCDKHGGRNRYDELISEVFDDAMVFRLTESRPRSQYRMGTCEFTFRTKAEELLPVALASMTAKYFREILMDEFNAFWKERHSSLKPTRGYPVDAARFRDDIADTADSLGITADIYWRNR